MSRTPPSPPRNTAAPRPGRGEGFGTGLGAATLFVFTLLVLVPAHVYLVNRSDVVVFLSEVLLLTVIFATGASLVLAALLALLPRPFRIRLTVLLLGISLLGWIHAYCLVWPYAVMDGGSIPWDAYAGRSLIDALLWVGVLGPLLWFAPRCYPHVGRACLGLLVIQVASLGISYSRSYVSPLDFFKNYYVDREPAFEFSSHQNVILIVLDAFQSDIFAEAVLGQENHRGYFTGFTYFPDTVAGANFTELAVPAILTGRIYDNSVPRDQFLKSSYLADSLPAILKRDLGFETHLYPWRGFANESLYYHEGVASNFLRRPSPWTDKLVDVTRLIDLGLFRSAPQFAKRLVYNESNWRVSDWTSRLLHGGESSPVATPADLATSPREVPAIHTMDQMFIDLAIHHVLPGQRLDARQGRPVFKYYHLAGLHAPVKMRRDFTKGIFEYNRAGLNEQAEAYARIMESFLNELKRLGIYDNSMIVITGDHGSGRTDELHLNPGSAPRTLTLDETATEGYFQRDKARGVPLLLVKRFGETGAIKTARVPASVVDIPATILAELKHVRPPVQALAGVTDFHGTSLYALTEQTPRPRYYGAIRWAAERSDYVNPITLYRIQGSSWEDDSWSYVKTLSPGK